MFDFVKGRIRKYWNLVVVLVFTLFIIFPMFSNAKLLNLNSSSSLIKSEASKEDTTAKNPSFWRRLGFGIGYFSKNLLSIEESTAQSLELLQSAGRVNEEKRKRWSAEFRVFGYIPFERNCFIVPDSIGEITYATTSNAYGYGFSILNNSFYPYRLGIGLSHWSQKIDVPPSATPFFPYPYQLTVVPIRFIIICCLPKRADFTPFIGSGIGIYTLWSKPHNRATVSENGFVLGYHIILGVELKVARTFSIVGEGTIFECEDKSHELVKPNTPLQQSIDFDGINIGVNLKWYF